MPHELRVLNLVERSVDILIFKLLPPNLKDVFPTQEEKVAKIAELNIYKLIFKDRTGELVPPLFFPAFIREVNLRIFSKTLSYHLWVFNESMNDNLVLTHGQERLS